MISKTHKCRKCYESGGVETRKELYMEQHAVFGQNIVRQRITDMTHRFYWLTNGLFYSALVTINSMIKLRQYVLLRNESMLERFEVSGTSATIFRS